MYSLAVRPLKANLPVESVVVPSTNVLSGIIRATVANSTGADVAASVTLPVNVPVCSCCGPARAAVAEARIMHTAAVAVIIWCLIAVVCCCLLLSAVSGKERRSPQS